MPKKTRIITTIDYERTGKQMDYLKVPQVRNDSAWGVVPIPIVVVANGSGPTVLLTGGLHGDEYEAQIAISDFGREIEHKEIQGRLIILPHLHYPAVEAGTRMSPIDHTDLNRCFPGDVNGTFAYKLAHYISEILLPLCDVSVDLHSGGRSLDFVPSTTMHLLPNRDQTARTLQLLDAFSAPYSVINYEVDAAQTLMTICEQRGILAMSSELGGSARVSRAGCEIAARGVGNVLRHLGILKGEIDRGPILGYSESRRMAVVSYDCYSFAPVDGVFRPHNALGDAVTAGDVAGTIYSIGAPDRKPLEVRYGHSGFLWGTRGLGPARAGDPLAVVVEEYQG